MQLSSKEKDPIKKWTQGLPCPLRFCAPNAGSLGSIPGQGTRSHMLQRRPGAVK